MYLLDTDTVIYGLKGSPQVVAKLQENASFPMGLSVITYGELVYGAHKSARKTENLAKVRRIGEIYPIFEVTKGVIESFGDLKAALETKGNRLDDFDLLIAATARMLGYRLVTNNERRFARINGLQTENWCK